MNKDKNMTAKEKELRKLSFLAEIASLYFEKHLSQSEIAERTFISRSRVSRLLKESKEKGLVTVKINFTGERYFELEEIIKKKFKLKDARIFNNRNKTDDEILLGLGNLAAEYLEDIISENTNLGISWGKAVYNTVNSLQGSKKKQNIKVIQLMGSASSDNEYIDVRELISTVSKLINAKAYYLNAPLYMEDNYARNILMKDPINAETLRLAVNADILLTGIGSMDSNNFSHLWKGYLTEPYMEELKRMGVVGYIFAYFYDAMGNVFDNDSNKRIVGIDISQIKSIKTVIGVAGGACKASAVLGALKGNFINVLVTDYDTANEILNLL